MASDHSRTKISLNIFHLPTLLLVIGSVFFWIELYFFDTSRGRTSFLVWIIFGMISIFVFWKNKNSIGIWFNEIREHAARFSRFQKILIFFGIIFCAGILVVSFCTSLLPPHLPQEYDSLNYHITVPRQHLIRGNFAHLEWSAADLFLLPLDHALAPFILSTRLPNKMPFFVFVLGLFGVMGTLLWRVSNDSLKFSDGFFVGAQPAVPACQRARQAVPLQNKAMPIVLKSSKRSYLIASNRSFLPVCCGLFAAAGLHGLSIQFGVAMFDIVMAYLLIASIDSWMSGNKGLAVMEFTFYVYSKSFVPFQMMLIGAAVGIVVWIGRKIFSADIMLFTTRIKLPVMRSRDVFLFIILSVMIAGPFWAKAFYRTGTPFYPFGVGIFAPLDDTVKNDSLYWASVREKARRHLATKDQYGQGRSWRAFAEHFWILAVPEKDVNNRFDYPMGFSYLLILGPFLYLLIFDLTHRRVDVMSLFVVFFWMSWWFGSQQSRFLYVPLLLMIVRVCREPVFLRNSFLAGLVFSVFLSCVSVARAHRHDFGRSSFAVLREIDRNLLEMSSTADRLNPTVISFEDAAFADFPVTISSSSLFILR